MDALTHVVIGASVAQLPLGPQKSRMSFGQKAMVGTMAALFPDIDYALFMLDPLDFLAYWHRAETHSLVMAPLWALLLTLGWRLFDSMKEFGYQLYWICLTVLISHIFLDSLTMYGTQWLAPFSDRKISLNLLFVVDAYFTLCAVIVLLVLYFLNGTALRWLVVLVPAAYLMLVYQIRDQASQRVDSNASISLLPQPFSPFYWQLIDEKHSGLYQAYLRLADDPVAARVSNFMGKPSQQQHYHFPDRLRWRHFPLFPQEPGKEQLAKEVWQHPSFTAFQDFARFPVLYRIEHSPEQTCVWFSDLRYHWPNEIPQFRYGMCQNQRQDWSLYRKKYFSQDAVLIPRH